MSEIKTEKPTVQFLCGGPSWRQILGLSPRRWTRNADGKTWRRERGITAQDIIIREHKRMGWMPGMGYLPKRKAVA